MQRAFAREEVLGHLIGRLACAITFGAVLAATTLAALPARAVAAAAAAPQYRLTDLGTLGGNVSSALAINSHGHVVGGAERADGTGHGYVFRDGIMIDLGTLGGQRSHAIDINDAGQVAGYSTPATSTRDFAYRWSNGTMTNLGALGGSGSYARGIGPNGEVVGDAELPMNGLNSGGMHAFLHTGAGGAVMTDLGDFGYGSNATDVNGAGQVVGSALRQFGPLNVSVERAVVYHNGTITEIPTIPERTSHAYRINEAGHVVGVQDQQAFLYRDGQVIDLQAGSFGSWSAAFGLNDFDDVVGYAVTSDFVRLAFVWRDGTMTDLNTVVDASGTDWVLQQARGINNAGQICGFGLNPDGHRRAFLLTPLPEPTAAATVLLLGITLTRRRRHPSSRQPSSRTFTRRPNSAER